MKSFEDITQLVNRHINSLPYLRKPESLYEPIKYVLAGGGKRLRPTLMLLAYNMFRDDVETILPQAIGLETYHNFTLLHDDLMDNADIRHGHPTVHKKWDANTAILSGDTMLVLAFSRMQQCDVRHLPSVMQVFTETALEIDEGQQYDIEFENRDDVTEEEYVEMIRLKTSVLLACATKIGAIMGDASDKDCQLLYRIGEQMGLAFQLQDDYLDVYGDEKVFGKAIGGDIMCNKKTFMLINALRKAEGQTKSELEQWIAAQNPDRRQKVQAVTAIYNLLGIDKLAQQRIEHHFAQAEQALNELNVPDERKAELRRYMLWLMKREK